jgi:integrase
MGGRPRLYEDLGGLRARESVNVWLRGLREGPGRNTALYHFAGFLRWRRLKGCESDPDRIVAECVSGTNRTLIDHLKLAQEYCLTAPGFEGDKKSTRSRVYRSVRSFYLANYVPLPQSRLRVNNQEESNEVEDDVTARQFLEMVRRVLTGTKISVRDRSIILTMLQGGLDDSTLSEVFNYVAYPQLVLAFGTPDYNLWDTSSCPVRIDLTRPKTSYRYYTFLDVDAVECLKDWLQVRQMLTGSEVKILPSDNPKHLPKSDPIYLNQRLGPIRPSNAWQVFNLSGKRAGINVRSGDEKQPYKGARVRYPFHSHECRDTMITLARGKVDVAVPKYLTGHNIDTLHYDKSPRDNPDHFREEYLKLARPYLNPISGKVLEARESLERELRAEFESRLGSLERQMQDYLPRRTSGVS